MEKLWKPINPFGMSGLNMVEWATHFYEIPDALENNDLVRNKSLALVEEEPIPAKALEGGDRKATFRTILTDFLSCEIGFEDAKREVRTQLPPHESPHGHDRSNTFNRQWDDRLVRSEGSRFYNHAVLVTLEERGDETCFILESEHQHQDKKCTQLLAGREASVADLREGVEQAFREGDWDAFPRIPYKPNCTHTITPVN
jgi:hypothetical protein